ncbi:DUF805 domain-containing protein [Pleomorphomonas sp. NRK KF1]|uniref:DUF805 domain-containing protein n=1 Tax=Pleomorphomonas sp. NRK KF1 TaxID=2943000 RepID=UPI0020434132|nr:DUF805 domain-containing protein [Pleomorphomonas sp. NRK KF1]MCM5554007.1 DUF805 domain-containing protein [Pleomorphomonas sp. NRK KF1]
MMESGTATLLMILIWILLPIPFVLMRAPAGANRFGEVGRPMGFGQAIGAFFSNYFNFSGRASRSEFWWAILFLFIVNTIVSFIPLLGAVWTLGIFFPSIALAARRLHDINRSGWFQLLSCLFPIGTIVLIVWYCTAPRDAAAG